MTDVWPRELAPRAISWTPMTPEVRGPRSIGGVQRRVASDAGFWRCRLIDVPLTTPTKIMLFRALMARLVTSTEAVLVPAYDTARAPHTLSGVTDPASVVPFADDAFFADDTGFLGSSGMAATKASAVLRATTIRCQVELGLTVQAGQYLSIGEWMHIGRGVTVSASDVRDQTIEIWPPLRAAISGSVAVEIANPACRMRLAGNVPELVLNAPLGRHGRVTIDLEEAV